MNVTVSYEPAKHPPCAVCGTPYESHGSHPTCASHPYNATFECGAIGVYSASKGFVGHPCPGAGCVQGCVLALGPNGSPGSESTRPDQPKLPESRGIGGSSIGLGAEGEQ